MRRMEEGIMRMDEQGGKPKDEWREAKQLRSRGLGDTSADDDVELVFTYK